MCVSHVAYQCSAPLPALPHLPSLCAGERVLASGSVQLPRFTLLESGSLLVSPAHLSDAGTYTCMASNSRGIDEASANLLVWGEWAEITGRGRNPMFTAGSQIIYRSLLWSANINSFRSQYSCTKNHIKVTVLICFSMQYHSSMILHLHSGNHYIKQSPTFLVYTPEAYMFIEKKGGETMSEKCE